MCHYPHGTRKEQKIISSQDHGRTVVTATDRGEGRNHCLFIFLGYVAENTHIFL